MKYRSLKIWKYSIAICLLLALSYSCEVDQFTIEEEENFEIKETAQYFMSDISRSDISQSNLDLLDTFIKTSNAKNKTAAVVIDTTNIKIVQYNTYTSYTFPTVTNTSGNVVQNVVISEFDSGYNKVELFTYDLNASIDSIDNPELLNNAIQNLTVSESFDYTIGKSNEKNTTRCLSLYGLGEFDKCQGSVRGDECYDSNGPIQVTVVIAAIVDCSSGGGGGSPGDNTGNPIEGGETGDNPSGTSGGGGSSGGSTTTTNDDPNCIADADGNCVGGTVTTIVLPTEGTEILLSGPDPCGNIATQLENESYQNSIETLSQNFDLDHETGFEATRSDGNYENVTPPRGHNSVDVSISDADVFGYTHVHQNPFTLLNGVEKNPTPIFSSDDVETFIFLIENADANNIPASELFAGVLSSTNHYQLRFTGDPSDIDQVDVTVLGDGGVNLYRRFIKGSESPEEGLLKYINELNIEGIELYEIFDDDSVVKLSLDETGTALLTPIPCN